MPLEPMRRSVLYRLFIIALLAMIFLANHVRASAEFADLPPRPTPVVTPSPTPTPRPAARARAVAETISYIELVTTPAADGRWTVVQWQGQDGAWHDVEGWRGTLVAGSKRWAVLARNFGEGPFRWVVYADPGGVVAGESQVFTLPSTGGELRLVRVALAP